MLSQLGPQLRILQEQPDDTAHGEVSFPPAFPLAIFSRKKETFREIDAASAAFKWKERNLSWYRE